MKYFKYKTPEYPLSIALIRELSPHKVAVFENEVENTIYFKINKKTYREYIFVLNYEIFNNHYMKNLNIVTIFAEYVNNFYHCDPNEIEEIFYELINVYSQSK